MTDTHGQHDQGEQLDPGLPAWERELIEQQQHDQGERRDRQIAAVREVMGWGDQPDAFNEQAVAATAAELVDAVLNAGGLCGDATESLILGQPGLVCTMPAGHAGRWHGDDNGARWTPRDDVDPTACPACVTDPHDEPTEPHVHATPYGYCVWAPGGLPFVDELRREAEARGWNAAVEALRNDRQIRTWAERLPYSDRWATNEGPGRQQLADYLEAVGPGAATVAHQIPAPGAGTTPCCGRPVFELPRTDRLTAHLPDVTCDAPRAPQTGADGPTHTEVCDDGRKGGSGTWGGQTCPSCGEPATGFRGEVVREGHANGWREVEVMAYTYEPCGCTRTVHLQARGTVTFSIDPTAERTNP